MKGAARRLLCTAAIASALAHGVPPAAASDAASDEAGARVAAGEVLTTLGAALKQALAEGDTAAAIAACREIAPAVAGRISRERGWRVTRVGTRVRNPLLGTPDAWEQGVLAAFAERAAAGESYADMTHAEVVEEPGGRNFRFMRAIGVQPVCLGCHGDPARIPEDVRAMLDAHYPADRAVGYAAGDLRGAVSVKQPLE